MCRKPMSVYGLLHAHWIGRGEHLLLEACLVKGALPQIRQLFVSVLVERAVAGAQHDGHL